MNKTDNLTEIGCNMSQLAKTLNLSQFTNSKNDGGDRETVGAVQMQFLQELKKQKGKVQAADDFTKG